MCTPSSSSSSSGSPKTPPSKIYLSQLSLAPAEAAADSVAAKFPISIVLVAISCISLWSTERVGEEEKDKRREKRGARRGMMELVHVDLNPKEATRKE